MKILVYSIVLAIFTLIFAGCDTWLDVDSKVEPDRTSLLATPQGQRTALTGIYSAMADKKLYGRKLTYYIPSILSGHYGSVGADVAYWSEYAYKGAGAHRDAIAEIEDIWGDLYHCIADANSIILALDGADASAADPVIMGEALGLRAFCHFELLRLFGAAPSLGLESEAIPYVTSLSATSASRSTVGEVCTKAVADLKASLEYLEADPIRKDADKSGRRLAFNYFACLTTLARVELWRGNLEEASAYAERALAETADIFPWVSAANMDADPLMTDELLFALDVQRLNEFTPGWAYPGGYSSRGTLMLLTQAGEYFYDEGDLRLSHWVENIGYDRYCVKFRDNGSGPSLMPMMRRSELMLIAAETAPTDTRRAALLNELRNHRGLQPLAAGADLPGAIADEYRREFLCEGQLWYYYKRILAESFPSGWGFTGDPELYKFDIPEDEELFSNPL